MDETLYVVLYRTGGTAKWEWKRTLNRLREQAAKDFAVTVERGGFPTVIVPDESFQEHGIPESYGAYEYLSVQLRHR